MSAIDCAVTNELRASWAEVRSECLSRAVSAVYCAAVTPAGRSNSSNCARMASSTCLTRYKTVAGAASAGLRLATRPVWCQPNRYSRRECRPDVVVDLEDLVEPRDLEQLP